MFSKFIHISRKTCRERCLYPTVDLHHIFTIITSTQWFTTPLTMELYGTRDYEYIYICIVYIYIYVYQTIPCDLVCVFC